MDEGFAAYAVRVEGLSGEVDYLVTYVVVNLYDKTYIAAAELVMHRKYLQATVAVSLKVGGVNIITCTLKIAKFFCGKYYTNNRSTPYIQP